MPSPAHNLSPRRRPSSQVLIALLMIAVPPTSLAYDDFGGYFSYIVSPQVCSARYANQEKFLSRSSFAQIRNTRNKALNIVCPLQRTHQSDRNGACNAKFSLRARIRLRPKVSMAAARVQLSFADDEQGTVPAVFKKDVVLTVSDSNWNGNSVYTDATFAEIVMGCIQKAANGKAVDLDNERWVPSAAITLPAGAMLRRLQFIGGENAP